MEKGLAAVASSKSLFRLVFVLLHNGVRALEALGEAGGTLPADTHAGWSGEGVSTRSSEMLVRQCVHLVFLALDLQLAVSAKKSDSHTEFVEKRLAEQRHADAYYAEVVPMCTGASPAKRATHAQDDGGCGGGLSCEESAMKRLKIDEEDDSAAAAAQRGGGFGAAARRMAGEGKGAAIFPCNMTSEEKQRLKLNING